MVIFFGWKDGKMRKEYISSSKFAIVLMANRLSGANLEIRRLEHCPGWDGGGWLHGGGGTVVREALQLGHLSIMEKQFV